MLGPPESQSATAHICLPALHGSSLWGRAASPAPSEVLSGEERRNSSNRSQETEALDLSCHSMTLGLSVPFSRPQFPHLYHETVNRSLRFCVWLTFCDFIGHSTDHKTMHSHAQHLALPWIGCFLSLCSFSHVIFSAWPILFFSHAVHFLNLIDRG